MDSDSDKTKDERKLSIVRRVEFIVLHQKPRHGWWWWRVDSIHALFVFVHFASAHRADNACATIYLSSSTASASASFSFLIRTMKAFTLCIVQLSTAFDSVHVHTNAPHEQYPILIEWKTLTGSRHTHNCLRKLLENDQMFVAYNAYENSETHSVPFCNCPTRLPSPFSHFQ